jgi:hypothetical protein
MVRKRSPALTTLPTMVLAGRALAASLHCGANMVINFDIELLRDSI